MYSCESKAIGPLDRYKYRSCPLSTIFGRLKSDPTEDTLKTFAIRFVFKFEM